jgi:cell division protein FtsQ
MRLWMPLPKPQLPRRPPARAVAACAGVCVVLLVGWLWLRDSSLVAVRQVDVTGISGSEAPRVRAALQEAARDMTTLHVRAKQLQTAVAPFPVVRSVDAHADFPHRLRVVVHEHVAVGALAADNDRVAVAADGTLLRGVATGGLPVVSVRADPAGDTVGDRGAQHAVELLAAAPAALRAKVLRVYSGPRGLTATLNDGPVLYFGGTERLRAKWIAVARVLDDHSSAGATYLDVRLPERPAAGGLEAPRQQEPDASAQVGAQPAQPQTSAGAP